MFCRLPNAKTPVGTIVAACPALATQSEDGKVNASKKGVKAAQTQTGEWKPKGHVAFTNQANIGRGGTGQQQEPRPTQFPIQSTTSPIWNAPSQE